MDTQERLDALEERISALEARNPVQEHPGQIRHSLTDHERDELARYHQGLLNKANW